MKVSIFNFQIYNIRNLIFLVLSALLLIYLLLPGPTSIADFPALPNSAKSTLSGDTTELPNVVGYFSNNYRNFTTNYYRQAFQKTTLFPFLPFTLNYPPEFAFTAIKDQTHSTFLEEYYYPFRESLFINGEEPFLEDGRVRDNYKGAALFEESGGEYQTKIVLRYYPSSIPVRLITWFGICVSIFLLWVMFKRIIWQKS